MAVILGLCRSALLVFALWAVATLAAGVLCVAGLSTLAVLELVRADGAAALFALATVLLFGVGLGAVGFRSLQAL